MKQHFNKNNELVGCDQNGFRVIDLNSGLILLSSHTIIGRVRTTALHTDKLNRLFVGNVNGIFEFRDSTLVHPGHTHPAFHNRVEDIHEYSDSTIVFRTKGFGVILWKGDSIVQLTDEDGLTSNMIEDVHVDENDFLWVGTLNGLNRITRENSGNLSVRKFTMANGLPSNEIYQIRSYEGQVWLCTAGGLVKFKEPGEDLIPVRPIIQQVFVAGSSANQKETSEFKYDNNDFEFKYLAINYRQNGQIPYRYRIDPKGNWQYTQNRSVNYPSLNPGKYTFEVQAQNQDGLWSEGSIYQFRILPPVWQTWWFRLLVILVIGASIYTFYKNRLNQLKRENTLQRQMTELEKAALQAQMNPHFIFNCLNSIQNFILQNDKKKAVEYLSRFAKLVRHNLNASVQGQVSLEEEVNLLDNYLALEQERFDHRFSYQIEVGETLKNQFIEFPPMLIQPYVENAVIHGLSKKDGGGKVKVHFSKSNSVILVSIKDNGTGIQTSNEKEKDKRHKSVGMSITSKRLKLLGTDPDNAVNIQAIHNDQQEVKGTEVTIQIKIKTS